ncbi:MAG TPA: porin family protein [Deltaproteobacteria bacterium]|nr:porin family protein [Deltaproteobacteria bacterium]
MRKTATVFCASVLFLLSLQAAGLCADSGYLGIQLGPQFLTSEDDVDTAAAFGIYGGYRFDKLLSLEASLTTGNHDVDPGGDLTITSILFGPRLSQQVDRSLVVYAGAGLGIYPIDYDGYLFDDSETETGIYLGAGVEFPLNGNFKAGLDLKYHVLLDDDTIDSDIVTFMVRLGLDI